MRLATAAAGALALAAVAMAVLAFTTGGDGDEREATAVAGGRASAGLAVWVAQGCGSCHTLAAANARGTIGPDLGSSLRGVPASSIKLSIVDPNAGVAAGYTSGTMPEDYASRITPRDLDRMVGFLRASAR